MSTGHAAVDTQASRVPQKPAVQFEDQTSAIAAWVQSISPSNRPTRRLEITDGKAPGFANGAELFRTTAGYNVAAVVVLTSGKQ